MHDNILQNKRLRGGSQVFPGDTKTRITSIPSFEITDYNLYLQIIILANWVSHSLFLAFLPPYQVPTSSSRGLQSVLWYKQQFQSVLNSLTLVTVRNPDPFFLALYGLMLSLQWPTPLGIGGSALENGGENTYDSKYNNKE